ncbi:MAG: hypothetical protein A2Y62_07810 [Candidatus Fischerbacteria bacterium RBG_13_37_8]|uniref:RNA polymerase sigma factor n=1 Tax=Candidatus Fischerbacteria bacterium RBG_13_37_8 TaxID=1817863 RepID=A0A1F5V945_9BACT|nr:MAG: hypothetical protein A2Y62_07810 [Candidatus Fischerbacteria bacterium RBG_13_37_8]
MKNGYNDTSMDFQETTFKYMKDLHSVAMRLTKNADEAEDLIQDTYLKAFRFFHKFKKGTNLRAWLFKIMMRLFYTRYRQKKLELIRTEPIPDEEIISLEADPENAYLEKFVDKEIVNAIDRLPQQFRTVLLLADVEELSYNEISEILKVPPGTIMSRLHRARKKLANELRSYALENGLLSATQT